MSVNASVSVSPRSESSPHIDDAKNILSGRRTESLKTHRSTSNETERGPDQQEGNRGVDAQSLSRELKTWSVIAQQPPQVKSNAQGGTSEHRNSNSSPSAASHDKSDEQPMSWKHKLAK